MERSNAHQQNQRRYLERHGIHMMSNYLTVLEESLMKKNAILDSIQEASRKQNELLKCEKLDLERFDELVEEKDGYLKELEKLDEGFEILYDKVKQELLENKAELIVKDI